MSIKRWLPPFSRKLLILPPLLIGIAVMAIAIQNRQSPERIPLTEIARPLRVTEVQRQQVAPKVVGYGVAVAARTWRAVAEVDGRVDTTYPRLDPGEIVEQGEVLVEIDPADYLLRLKRLESQAESLAAQVLELETTRNNDEATLVIEQEALTLLERDLERNRKLRADKAVAQAVVETSERLVLLQRLQKQKLTNSLALLPAKIARVEAEKQAVDHQFEEAFRDLARTEIAAPFRGRLSSVDLEPGQYVGLGETLFEMHGLDASEVEVQIPLDDLRLLAPSQKSAEVESITGLLRGLKAVVRVRSGDWSREWPGQLVRIREQVQPSTRTLGVIVRVERTAGSAQPDKPPLLEGMFCEVEFRGEVRPGQLVIPRVAVRDGRVYVVNQENRLESRAISSMLPVDEFVSVTGALKEGDRVVLSDPSPAVDGMLVAPVLIETGVESRLVLLP